MHLSKDEKIKSVISNWRQIIAVWLLLSLFYFLVQSMAAFATAAPNVQVALCMTHAAVGGHVLLLMWAYMHCAICSLRAHAVINVHGVHSPPLLMWLIYIKSFPICQSQTMASHGEEAQGVLFLFILPYLPHIFIASWPPVLPYQPRDTHVHIIQSHHGRVIHLNPVLSVTHTLLYIDF